MDASPNFDVVGIIVNSAVHCIVIDRTYLIITVKERKEKRR